MKLPTILPLLTTPVFCFFEQVHRYHHLDECCNKEIEEQRKTDENQCREHAMVKSLIEQFEKTAEKLENNIKDTKKYAQNLANNLLVERTHS